MWNLDWQLAKSPWFKRSGGQDHVIVMSHWLHAFRWNEEIPRNLKRCSAIAFEDKNVYRLAFNYSRQCQQQRTCTHTLHSGTCTHTPFHPGTSFAFAKGQPIMLPSLYVNAHVPCNTTGDLTDFFFAGSFTNPGTTRFYGCVLCLPTSTHLCEI